MAISSKTSKILWANAAGRCAFPGCETLLCTGLDKDVPHYTLGEMAHIRGEKPGASRHDAKQSEKDRDDYPNLILLCPTHHAEIDKPENAGRFDVGSLLKMKADHEKNIRERLGSLKFANKNDVARRILPLVQENHAVFIAYGPHSEIAKKNPQSDAHEMWLSERLATIVPNNRQINELITGNKGLFSIDEQKVLSELQLHIRSYERWVSEEISYEAVVRFPDGCDKLITEIANAGPQ